MSDTKYDHLLEKYRDGSLSRRGFLGAIAASAAAVGLAGGPISAFAATKSIRFDGWGGSVSDALRKHAFEPYTKKTGIKVVDGTFSGVDEFFTRVRTRAPGTFTVFHSSGVFDYARHLDAGLDVNLDESKIASKT